MMKSKSNKDIEARTSMASPKADLRELRDNSRATVQEIQSFLRELKGKGPKEMLGAIAASDLFRSVIISTALVTGAILLFTAVPYFAGDDEKKASAQKTGAEALLGAFFVPTKAFRGRYEEQHPCPACVVHHCWLRCLG